MQILLLCTFHATPQKYVMIMLFLQIITKYSTPQKRRERVRDLLQHVFNSTAKLCITQ